MNKQMIERNEDAIDKRIAEMENTYDEAVWTKRDMVAQLIQIKEDLKEIINENYVAKEKIEELKRKVKLEHVGWINNWGADLVSLELIDELLKSKEAGA